MLDDLGFPARAHSEWVWDRSTAVNRLTVFFHRLTRHSSPTKEKREKDKREKLKRLQALEPTYRRIPSISMLSHPLTHRMHHHG